MHDLIQFQHIPPIHCDMILLTFITLITCVHNSIGNNINYLSNTGDDKTPKNIICNMKNTGKLFDNFVKEHGKRYKDEEEYQRRYEIFIKNIIEINELNQKSRSEKYGITKFADMTLEEFYKGYTGLANYSSSSGSSYPSRRILDDVEAPEEFDWREKNVVTSVKDQKGCSSCWAFSAVGVAEGQHAKKHGQLYSLSEQQMIDCWSESHGCYGNLPHWGLIAVSGMGGFMKFEDYPYTAQEGTCAFHKERVVVKVKGGTLVDVKDEEELKKLVYQYGPLSIGIYASPSLRAYRGNVYAPTDCLPNSQADHAVLLVGYGSDNGTPYWIIKNSWGDSWGENGYVRMLRGKKICSILSYVATGDIV